MNVIVAAVATLMHTTRREQRCPTCPNHLPNCMNQRHKDKTLTTLLAFLFGGIGAHRFYLYGKKDHWAWLHVALFPLSIFAGFIEALIAGLTPDEKWDALHNSHSARQSRSGWPLALLLVLTMGVGAFAVIATIARMVDYLYTGGAYG